MQLKPYQADVVRDVFAKHRGKCIIAVPMGGGKTPMSCVVLRNAPLPHLVVCQSNKQYDWQDETKAWLGVDYSIGKFSDRMIVSYRKVKDVLDKEWQSIVIDESHNLKNHKSKCTQMLSPLVRKAKVALLLSGTPLKSCPSELWSQMNMLRPLKMNYWKYTEHFCSARRDPNFGWKLGAARHKDELSALFDTYAIRVSRDVVQKELPPFKREEVIVDISDEYKQRFHDMFRELKECKDELEAQQLVNHMVRVSGEAIIKPAVDIIASKAAEKTVIVFAYNKDLMKEIASELDLKGITSVIISGDMTNLKKKHECVQKIRRGEVQVGILSISCCKDGIDLTPVQQTFYVQRLWNSTDLEQSESRTYRQGATGEVTCTYIMGRGTYDERQKNKINYKARLVDSILPETKKFKLS